jgi:hypothetical protein
MADDTARKNRKVLSVLNKPRINRDIEKLTRLSKADVNKTLHRLRELGEIITVGATRATRHMRVSAAIEMLVHDMHDIRRRTGAIEAKLGRRRRRSGNVG